MTPFKNTRDLYICAEQLFYRIQEEDPKATNVFLKSRLLISLQTDHPDGIINLDGRSQRLKTSFGQKNAKPDLNIQLSTDTLHHILMGQMGLRKALGQKKVTVQGPVFKVMTLAPLFDHGKKIYPQILREQGLM